MHLSLAGACAACMVAAACSDSQRNLEPSTQRLNAPNAAPASATSQNSELWTPSVAVALIPDVGGYFRDCNCSGGIVGGLERVPHASNNAIELHFYFYGSTLFSDERGSADKDLPQAAVERIVDATASLWSNLGRVHWTPSPSDMEVLRRHGVSHSPLQQFIVKEQVFQIEGVKMDTKRNPQTMSLKIAQREYAATAPARRIRGREVAVVGIWQSVAGGGQDAVFSRTLGAVAVHRPSSGSPAGLLVARELARSGVVVSIWRATLLSQMPASPFIGKLLDQYEVESSHGIGSGAVDAAAFRRDLHTHVQHCETCHPKATKAWLESSHSTAWLRLQSVRSHTRATCLVCHVEQSKVFDGFTGLPHDERMGMAAVTCRSCHTTPARPNLASCEACHNANTDPRGHYRARIKDVCPGDIFSDRRSKCTLR